MPSTTFPRPSILTVNTTTALDVPGPLATQTRSGRIQTRGSTMRGRRWSETYNPMFIGSAEAEGWLAWVRWAWNTGATFTIKHLTTPGSGTAPNGTGSAGVTVNGAGQTGTTLNTTGWPVSTSNVAMAGDIIKVAGVSHVLQVVDNASSDGSGNSALSVNPPIFTGSSPSTGAAITTTDVTISAKIITQPNFPPVGNAFWYEGFTITFNEAP